MPFNIMKFLLFLSLQFMFVTISSAYAGASIVSHDFFVPEGCTLKEQGDGAKIDCGTGGYTLPTGNNISGLFAWVENTASSADSSKIRVCGKSKPLTSTLVKNECHDLGIGEYSIDLILGYDQIKVNIVNLNEAQDGSLPLDNGLYNKGYVFPFYSNECPYMGSTANKCIQSVDISPSIVSDKNCYLLGASLSSTCSPAGSCPCNDDNQCNQSFMPTDTNPLKSIKYDCYVCHARGRTAISRCLNYSKNNPILQGIKSFYNASSATMKAKIESSYGAGSYICAYAINTKNSAISGSSPNGSDKVRIGCIKHKTVIGPRPYPRIAMADPKFNFKLNPASHLFITKPFVEPFRDEDGDYSRCFPYKKEVGESARGTFFRPKIKIKFSDNVRVITFNASGRNMASLYGSTKYSSQGAKSGWSSVTPEPVSLATVNSLTCAVKQDIYRSYVCTRIEYDTPTNKSYFVAYYAPSIDNLSSPGTTCNALESSKKLLKIGFVERPPLKYKINSNNIPKLPIEMKQLNKSNRYPIVVSLDPSEVPTDIDGYHAEMATMSVNLIPTHYYALREKVISSTSRCGFLFTHKVCIEEDICTPLLDIDANTWKNSSINTCASQDCKIYNTLESFCTVRTHCDESYSTIDQCQKGDKFAAMLDLKKAGMSIEEYGMQMQWRPSLCLTLNSIDLIDFDRRKLFGDYGSIAIEHGIQLGSGSSGKKHSLVKFFEKDNDYIIDNILTLPAAYISSKQNADLASYLENVFYDQIKTVGQEYFGSSCNGDCISKKVSVRPRNMREMGGCLYFDNEIDNAAEYDLTWAVPKVYDNSMPLGNTDGTENRDITDVNVPLGCRFLDIAFAGPGGGGSIPEKTSGAGKDEEGCYSGEGEGFGTSGAGGVIVVDMLKDGDSDFLRVVRASGAKVWGSAAQINSPYTSADNVCRYSSSTRVGAYGYAVQNWHYHALGIFNQNKELVYAEGGRGNIDYGNSCAVTGKKTIPPTSVAWCDTNSLCLNQGDIGKYNASQFGNNRAKFAIFFLSAGSSSRVGVSYFDKRRNSSFNPYDLRNVLGASYGEKLNNISYYFGFPGQISIGDPLNLPGLFGSYQVTKCYGYPGTDAGAVIMPSYISEYNKKVNAAMPQSQSGTNPAKNTNPVTANLNNYQKASKCISMCPRSNIKIQIDGKNLVCEYGGMSINKYRSLNHTRIYDSQMPQGGIAMPTHCFDDKGTVYFPNGNTGIQKCPSGQQMYRDKDRLYGVCSAKNSFDSAERLVTSDEGEHYISGAGTYCDKSGRNCVAIRYSSVINNGARIFEKLTSVSYFGKSCLPGGFWAIGWGKEAKVPEKILSLSKYKDGASKDASINTVVTTYLATNTKKNQFACPTINPTNIPFDVSYSLNAIWPQAEANTTSVPSSCLPGFIPYSSLPDMHRKCSSTGIWKGFLSPQKPCLKSCETIEDRVNLIKWEAPSNYSNPVSLPVCIDKQIMGYKDGVKQIMTIKSKVPHDINPSTFARTCNMSSASDPWAYGDVQNKISGQKNPTWGPIPDGAKCVSAAYLGGCIDSRKVCYDAGIDKEETLGHCYSGYSYDYDGLPSLPPSVMVDGSRYKDASFPKINVKYNQIKMLCTFVKPKNTELNDYSLYYPFMPLGKVPKNIDFICSNAQIQTGSSPFSEYPNIYIPYSKGYQNTKVSELSAINSEVAMKLTTNIKQNMAISGSDCRLSKSSIWYKSIMEYMGIKDFCSKVCYNDSKKDLNFYDCYKDVAKDEDISQCMNVCDIEAKEIYYSSQTGITSAAPPSSATNVVHAKYANSKACFNYGLPVAIKKLKENNPSFTGTIGNYCNAVHYSAVLLKSGSLSIDKSSDIFKTYKIKGDKECYKPTGCSVLGNNETGIIIAVDDSAQIDSSHRFVAKYTPIKGTSNYNLSASNIFIFHTGCYSGRTFVLDVVKIDFADIIDSNQKLNLHDLLDFIMINKAQSISTRFGVNASDITSKKYEVKINSDGVLQYLSEPRLTNESLRLLNIRSSGDKSNFIASITNSPIKHFDPVSYKRMVSTNNFKDTLNINASQSIKIKSDKTLFLHINKNTQSFVRSTSGNQSNLQINDNGTWNVSIVEKGKKYYWSANGYDDKVLGFTSTLSNGALGSKLKTQWNISCSKINGDCYFQNEFNNKYIYIASDSSPGSENDLVLLAADDPAFATRFSISN
ncbi:hypothetical protein N9A04_00360 [Rickettsiales bacterium]|nr:hypothetical protein [Rickettsiales bacterium]